MRSATPPGKSLRSEVSHPRKSAQGSSGTIGDIMTPMPVFEIGVWNAWIPMLYFPLHPLIMMLVHRTPTLDVLPPPHIGIGPATATGPMNPVLGTVS